MLQRKHGGKSFVPKKGKLTDRYHVVTLKTPSTKDVCNAT